MSGVICLLSLVWWWSWRLFDLLSRSVCLLLKQKPSDILITCDFVQYIVQLVSVRQAAVVKTPWTEAMIVLAIGNLPRSSKWNGRPFISFLLSWAVIKAKFGMNRRNMLQTRMNYFNSAMFVGCFSPRMAVVVLSEMEGFPGFKTWPR